MAGIKAQLSKFIDFNSNEPNAAIMVNNYDWMKNFSFLDFIREVGKHITVNYMMSKDSVKKRLSADSTNGMSFTEFTYQLVQGYDFLYLRRNYNCLFKWVVPTMGKYHHGWRIDRRRWWGGLWFDLAVNDQE